MKAIKIVAYVLVAYVLVVVLFESLIGYFQPQNQGTIVIVTTDSSGTAKQRVVARLDSGGALYIAANHWPRAWYSQVLANPDIKVVTKGAETDYHAVQVTGAEFDRVNAEHPLGPAIRFLTGFPPRRLMRLEPVAPVVPAAPETTVPSEPTSRESTPAAPASGTAMG
jgi:F420H(2)-dependent quinone reductase